MEELRNNLVELRILLENQHNSISKFIEKLILKMDSNDYSFIDEILGATKIQDFMNYKAAYLFSKIWDITNQIKKNNVSD
ncbi:hypothetical protein FACS1894182_15030 [Bacteroidia bacterium]|nr:hypothetical protein FACS1894182_15030 [Bacteroidia bacterium]